MNYIEELNAFRDYLMINRLSTGQIALWYALMQINNMTAWLEWFTAANQTLQLMTGLSRQGLDKARNQLQQIGLIDYKSGTTRQAGKYRVNLISQLIRSNSRLISSQIVDKLASNQESNSRLISSTLNKLNKTNIDNDDNNTAPSIYQDIEKELKRPLSSMEFEIINGWIDSLPLELIKEACKRAVLSESFNLKYIDRIILNWQKNNVKSLADIEAYDAAHQRRGEKQHGAYIKPVGTATLSHRTKQKTSYARSSSDII